MLSEEKLQAEVTTEIAQTATEEGKPEAARKPLSLLRLNLRKSRNLIRSRLSQMIQGVVGSFTAVAFNAAQILVVLVTVFFGVIFTVMDPRPIFGAIFLIVPERRHEQTLVILQRVGRFVPAWAFATLLAMLTVGLLVFLLMWPFFGLVDALVLGLIAGVFEAIPYLGPILSAVPALLFAMGEGGMTPLWVLVAYLAVQVLENNVICPLHHGAQHEAAFGGGHLFHALMCRRLRCAGCFGRGTPGCHCGYRARRTLSKAFSSHGNGRRSGSSGTKSPARKAARQQVTGADGRETPPEDGAKPAGHIKGSTRHSGIWELTSTADTFREGNLCKSVFCRPG